MEELGLGGAKTIEWKIFSVFHWTGKAWKMCVNAA